MSIDLSFIAERPTVRVRWIVNKLRIPQNQRNRTLVWKELQRLGWVREHRPYDNLGARWLNPRWHQ